MVIKSCILDGFWAARPKRRKVIKSLILEMFWAAGLKPRKVIRSIHWPQNRSGMPVKSCFLEGFSAAKLKKIRLDMSSSGKEKASKSKQTQGGSKQKQAKASKCKYMQSNASKCKQKQTNAGESKQKQVNGLLVLKGLIGVGKFWLVVAGCGWLAGSLA